MNNLIRQTYTQERLAAFQLEPGGEGSSSNTNTKLLLKEAKNLLWSEWTTLPNIKQTYEVMYDEMLDAGIAISLLIPIFTDIDGNPVDKKMFWSEAIHQNHQTWMDLVC